MRIKDLTAAQINVKEGAGKVWFPIDQDDGTTGKINLTDLSRNISYQGQEVSGLAEQLLDNNTAVSKVLHQAAIHNQIFRGKKIEDPATMIDNISKGNFDDLYIGDWFEVTMPASVECKNTNVEGDPDTETVAITQRAQGIRMVCVGLMTNYNVGYPDESKWILTKYHAMFMPMRPLCYQGMNKTNSTTENYAKSLVINGAASETSYNTLYTGYIGSRMRNTILPGLETALTTNNAFLAGHIIHHQELIAGNVNTTVKAQQTNWDGMTTQYWWVDSGLELLSEPEVYGHSVFGGPFDVGNRKTQLPYFKLFGLQDTMNRESYWLSAVASSAYFARVHDSGGATYRGAQAALGVRPRFLVG